MDKEAPNFTKFPEEEVRQIVTCREFSQFLDSQKSVDVGKSNFFKIREKNRTDKYGVPSAETVRGFEIVRDRVYPNVARAVRQLNRYGIITRKQLAEANLEELLSKKGFGPRTYYISLMIQNICREEAKGENFAAGI